MARPLKTSIYTLVLTCSLLVLGCQTKEEPLTREKSLSQGYALMDEGNYSAAILYFEELLKADQHHHVKLALASAYAGRAEVQLGEIYSFTVVKNFKAPPISLPGVDLEKQNGAQQTLSLITSLATHAEQWNRIPNVEDKARKDLQAALKVLNEDLTPGVRLYAAALRIVLLKSSVTQGFADLTTLHKERSKNKICGGDLKPYFDWALKIIDGFVALTVDLEKAFPENPEQYIEAREQLLAGKKAALALTWPKADQCL